MIKIVSWNVNSIKARLLHLQDYLKKESPDFLLLQELKSVEADLPHLEISALGYHVQAIGQKSYNGVAILSKQPCKIVFSALPDAPDDGARYIEIVTDKNLHIACVYIPNGQEISSDKYQYKLHFLKSLTAHLQKILKDEVPFIIGGDFNIAPYPIDIFDPIRLQNDTLFYHQARDIIRGWLNAGFVDTYRALHPDTRDAYSWWDYRDGAFARNHGARIDYILASPRAADFLKESSIDLSPRHLERPSDHTPVVAGFSF